MFLVWVVLTIIFLGKKATSVTARDIRCTQLSMAFFDRMETLGVTCGNGQLSKCLDTPVGDFIVSDKLREVALFSSLPPLSVPIRLSATIRSSLCPADVVAGGIRVVLCVQRGGARRVPLSLVASLGAGRGALPVRGHARPIPRHCSSSLQTTCFVHLPESYFHYIFVSMSHYCVLEITKRLNFEYTTVSVCGASDWRRTLRPGLRLGTSVNRGTAPLPRAPLRNPRPGSC